jgi:hypothetical protein
MLYLSFVEKLNMCELIKIGGELTKIRVEQYWDIGILGY